MRTKTEPLVSKTPISLQTCLTPLTKTEPLRPVCPPLHAASSPRGKLTHATIKNISSLATRDTAFSMLHNLIPVNTTVLRQLHLKRLSVDVCSTYATTDNKESPKWHPHVRDFNKRDRVKRLSKTRQAMGDHFHESINYGALKDLSVLVP